MNLLYQDYACRSTDESLRRLGSNVRGLTNDEASARLALHGPNSFKRGSLAWISILARQFKSSFIYLLIAAVLISCSLGEFTDAVIIILFIAINSALGFWQEFKSEKALAFLEDFWREETCVLRDGTALRVPTDSIVPGDIVTFKAGSLIPADVKVIEASDLTINESILTGESKDESKNADTLKTAPASYHETTNVCFSGTTVATGSGLGVVFATGKQSVLGTLQALVSETRRSSAFEEGIGSLSRFILRMVLLTLAVVFVLNLLIKGASGVNELLLFSIALAVSVIPEALPLVTTVSLSSGAMRLAKQHVVVRRLSAIEDLGSITVLCTDKTGTITQNILTVKSLDGVNRHELLECALAASGYRGNHTNEHPDGFDLALWHAATHEQKQQLASAQPPIFAIPFDPERRMNSVLVRHGTLHELVVRGAPESVLARCGLTTSGRATIQEQIHLAGSNGLRVIAVASKHFAKKTYSIKDESALAYHGFIAFHDPLKPDTLKTIAKAKDLGVAVTILTGDAPEVAGSVARSIGLLQPHETVLTGDEFMELSGEEQLAALAHHHVFARLSPEQKFRIVELLKKTGTVGFLGEGFNDAPALKAAHVAIVVKGASDISRESADVVLLQKSLYAIISGIEEGRRIFANTVKYIKSTLTSNFGNFYAIATVSLLVPFLPMLPIQILLVNLLSDFPMIAVATDTVGPDALHKPHKYDVKEIALMATILGLVSTLFDFAFFGYFRNHGAETLQTMWFIESILTELALIYSIRSRKPFWKSTRPSTTIILLSIVATILTIGIPFTAFGHSVFHFIRPSASYILFTILFVLAYFVTSELVKLWYYRFVRKGV